MRWALHRIGAVLMVLLWSAGARAQPVPTGKIRGVVRDVSGAPVANVTVVVSSPALLGTNSELTDEDGLYVMPDLPPGRYEVVLFPPRALQKLRASATVIAGRTTQLDMTFGGAAQADVIVPVLHHAVDIHAPPPPDWHDDSSPFYRRPLAVRVSGSIGGAPAGPLALELRITAAPSVAVIAAVDPHHMAVIPAVQWVLGNLALTIGAGLATDVRGVGASSIAYRTDGGLELSVSAGVTVDFTDDHALQPFVGLAVGYAVAWRAQ